MLIWDVTSRLPPFGSTCWTKACDMRGYGPAKARRQQALAVRQAAAQPLALLVHPQHPAQLVSRCSSLLPDRAWQVHNQAGAAESRLVAISIRQRLQPGALPQVPHLGWGLSARHLGCHSQQRQAHQGRICCQTRRGETCTTAPSQSHFRATCTAHGTWWHLQRRRLWPIAGRSAIQRRQRVLFCTTM